VFPLARKDRLTIRELHEETLVYDQDRHKAHCLNATAREVWRHCDGQTSVDELARIVALETGIASASAVVGLALEQLARRHLLEAAPEAATDRVSRREALKKLAVGAALLPLIMTVATKTAAQSLSDTSDASDDPPPSTSPVQVTVQPTINVNTGGGSKAPPPAPATPCRTRGQSCVAAASGQRGTCCAGLTCTGVSMNAGVCG
jgi:coenzyme PQQ synthesis protein D (PqqD)